MITVEDGYICIGDPPVEVRLGVLKKNYVDSEYQMLAYSVYHGRRAQAKSFKVNGNSIEITTGQECTILGVQDHRHGNQFDKRAYQVNPLIRLPCDGTRQQTSASRVVVGKARSSLVSVISLTDVKYGSPVPGGYKWILGLKQGH